MSRFKVSRPLPTSPFPEFSGSGSVIDMGPSYERAEYILDQNRLGYREVSVLVEINDVNRQYRRSQNI